MSRKGSVWVFMVVAFGFSWLFWIPDALIAQDLWQAPQGLKSFLAGPFNLGPWGPLFSAIAVTFMYQGSAGVKTLLKRGLTIRLGRWWWVILLMFPVLIGGSLLLATALDDPLPDLPALAQPVALPIALVYSLHILPRRAFAGGIWLAWLCL